MAPRVISLVACGLVAVVGGLIALVVLSERAPVDSSTAGTSTPDAQPFVLGPPPPPLPPPPPPPPPRPPASSVADAASVAAPVDDEPKHVNVEDNLTGQKDNVAKQTDKAVAQTANSGTAQDERAAARTAHDVATQEKQVAPSQAAQEAPAEPLPPWPQVEARFAALRKNRTKPADSLPLNQYYVYLAAPRSTGSQGYPEHCARLAEWRRDVPESTAALVCLGIAHTQWAWQARGGGWAHTVTKEGWELFHTRLTEARRLLELAVERGVEDGQAHASLLTIAMAQQLEDEQTRAWFSAGQKLDPLFVRLYVQMAIGLMPRWGGEPGDVERFAEEAAGMVPGDDGLEMFAWIAKEVHQYEFSNPVTLFWGEYDRELLVKAAEVLAQRHSESQSAVQFAALCAVATQDHEATQRIRPLIGEFRPENRVWPWEGGYQEFLKWCEAPLIPTGESKWIWGTQFHAGNIAFAPDPRYVWCGQGFGSEIVRLLDLETGGVAMSLTGPASRLEDLTFDQEKGWVLARLRHESFTGWVLWDLRVPVPVPYPIERRCVATAINPRLPQVAWVETSEPRVGQELVAELRFYDVEAGKAGPTVKLPGYTKDLIFSPDGTSIVTGGTRPAVWDVATGKKKSDLPGIDVRPRPETWCTKLLGFADDGQLWAIGATLLPNQIPLARHPQTKPVLLKLAADGATSQVVIEDLTAEGKVSQDASILSSDARWLAVPEARSGNFNQPIQIWDVQSGKMVKEIAGHWRPLDSMAFSPDSKQLATIGLFGGALKIWSLEDLRSGSD